MDTITIPAWLAAEPGPKMLLEMLALYGTREKIGAGSNPVILGWAKELGLEKVYRDDATPWCGLAVAIAAKRAGWDAAPGGNALWAQNWAKWGTRHSVAMLGDVLVFTRDGGGHVGLYVGEDATSYHVLGGNQLDMVKIVRKPKKPILAIRRAPWRIGQPSNVRVVPLSAAGATISSKED